jgi:transposase
MVFREVSVIEVREVLRAWLAGKSERAVAEQAGVDRKTGKRYVEAARAAGLSREGGEGQLTDELIGQVVSVVRPVRPDGHGLGWAELEARGEQIRQWADGGVPVVKIGILLGRQGVVVAERTLHRFAAGRCGGTKVTTPVDDGPPGGELQIDFGDLGLIPAGEGKRRKLRALVFTACFSRYMFAYLTFSMTLEEVIAGCEEAWVFFGGVFRVVVPDNMSPVVAKADAVNPRLTREWLEYSQARGFVTDPARVRSPRDKGRVESGVKYVQGSFFAGESFLDLADARSRMAGWLAGTANVRVHGTTRQVPAAVFAAREADCLLPAPADRYQVPYWAQVKVHVDYHVQVARALYSVPWRLAGAKVMARADEHLVKIYLRDQLIKTHPRKRPGGRSTDISDMPPGVEGYATRSADRIASQADACGGHIGAYARRLLDGGQPWMMMRSAYRLIGLAKRYGAAAADAACARALDVDVIDVSKIESMLKNATENAPPAATAAGLAPAAGGGRFARDPAEYATATGVRLRVVPGGDPDGCPPARPAGRP